jgi:hypothetical protein
MANAAVEIKVPADIEYRVIGNALGLMIACGGLLGGMMVSQGSTDYWREDIVPLGLAFLLAFRLMRSLVMTMIAAQALPARSAPSISREDIHQEHASLGQLPETMNYSPEQVIEEVAKRIESQKANAAKRAAK